MNDKSPPTAAGRALGTSAVWMFYCVFVFEIVFMISPFALTFYSAFGPTMTLLNRGAATSWLTKFNLPHFSHTGNAFLDSLHAVGPALLLAGLVAFLAAALPVYVSKLRRTGAVTGGVYRQVRHPQYLALALAGLGAILLWPRMIAWLAFVTMLFAYSWLARWEEAVCLQKFGASYRTYMHTTGRFGPRWLDAAGAALAARLPDGARVPARVGAFLATVAITAWFGSWTRDWSFGKTATLFASNAAVLSPADLSGEELQRVFDLVRSDAQVEAVVAEAAGANVIIHVVPEEWRIPDLPISPGPTHEGGHHQPRNFGRNRFRVLVSRAQTHGGPATGPPIVTDAYGLETRLLVRVNVENAEVVEVREAPTYVRWGRIFPPLF